MENHTHFLKLLDFTPAEIQQFLDTAADLKAKKKAGIPHRYLEGKNVALIFEKTSTRTRCAFEVACQDLGMGSTYLGPTGRQIGVKEILADFLTSQEHCGRLKGIKLVYLGDARFNMGNSLMVGCAKMGMHFVACAPKAYMPDQKLIDTCLRLAAETGAVLEFIEDPMEAVKNADVLYTDVWVSMGEPMEVWQERIAALAPYQVTKALMDNAGPQCRFMHCLPAYHDHKTKVGKEMGEKFGREAMEVTDEVFESPASIVFDEAENRMHTIKAVMYELMK